MRWGPNLSCRTLESAGSRTKKKNKSHGAPPFRRRVFVIVIVVIAITICRIPPLLFSNLLIYKTNTLAAPFIMGERSEP